jgi:hypothetical protein
MESTISTVLKGLGMSSASRQNTLGFMPWGAGAVEKEGEAGVTGVIPKSRQTCQALAPIIHKMAIGAGINGYFSAA